MLYAVNERYLMNEKGSLPGVRTLSRSPAEMEARVGRAYALLAGGRAEEAWSLLEALHREVAALAERAGDGASS